MMMCEHKPSFGQAHYQTAAPLLWMALFIYAQRCFASSMIPWPELVQSFQLQYRHSSWRPRYWPKSQHETEDIPPPKGTIGAGTSLCADAKRVECTTYRHSVCLSVCAFVVSFIYAQRRNRTPRCVQSVSKQASVIVVVVVVCQFAARRRIRGLPNQ